ncbi:MAG: hypothetical protein GY705_00975 [Bacteroidetes bacterium]|nr:hypothetical protein [Bacteroidota bacterium]
MKIFKDTTKWPSKRLLKQMQKFYFVIFGFGFMIGAAILMAGDASKNNDFEDTLILTGIAAFFLFISVLLYTFVHKKIIPEIERRLSNE